MKKAWWKEGVVYQIYPRSFCDSNGDGIGDLPGIVSKVDYLAELGIDVVWLSPVYDSPNDDNGYDIRDYRVIMREFGMMDDWDRLLEELHARGIRLVMDLVVNHTSDEHAWFVESCSSRDNRYRDYYVWKPGKNGQEPNNWASIFGGSAWQFDQDTGEYYLHLFSRKQPDLNWENPAVRNEVYEMMRFWLDKGIDGFRMDVINMISKPAGLPDAPITATTRFQDAGQYYTRGPHLMEFLLEMKREVTSRYDILTVGETPLATAEDGAMITDEETGALNMLFQFDHMYIDNDSASSGTSLWSLKQWQLLDLKEVMTRWQDVLGDRGWNSLYLCNHDQPRPVSRFGNDGEFRVRSAKMLGTFLHMQRGTPYVYQGEEIGMTNVHFDSIEEYRDIQTLNMYRELSDAADISHDEVMRIIRAKSRDNARTPMQWNAAPNAGFSTGTPWIAVNPNYPDINVDEARKDPDSVYHYYRALIRLRKEHPIVVYGSYRLILKDHAEIYAYVREMNEQKLLVVLNFFGGSPFFELPADIPYSSFRLLISNCMVDESEHPRTLTLRPYEARVYLLDA